MPYWFDNTWGIVEESGEPFAFCTLAKFSFKSNAKFSYFAASVHPEIIDE